MNLKLMFLKKLLEDKEREKLEAAIKRDKVIIPSITKIVQHCLDGLNRPTKKEDFDKASWPYEQAFKEGGKAELLKILSILEEKE